MFAAPSGRPFLVLKSFDMSVYFIYAKAPTMARFKPLNVHSWFFAERLANASRFFDKAAALALVDRMRRVNPSISIELRAYRPRRLS